MSFLYITDPVKRDLIVEEFSRTKKNIYQNSLSEKLGDIGLQENLEKLYLPITKSQSAQTAVLSKELVALKPSLQVRDNLMVLGPLATEYLKPAVSKLPISDRTFGLYSQEGRFYIGDTEVSISEDDIQIGQDVYDGTPGLWELITSKTPKNYTEQDIERYTDILIQTNAIIDPVTKRPKASKGDKYMKIIKPIYEKSFKGLKQIGHGIAMMAADLNALVEMLSLRVASYQAGNTGVRNEIVDLADELRRQGLMPDESYKTLMLRL